MHLNPPTSSLHLHLLSPGAAGCCWLPRCCCRPVSAPVSRRRHYCALPSRHLTAAGPAPRCCLSHPIPLAAAALLLTASQAGHTSHCHRPAAAAAAAAATIPTPAPATPAGAAAPLRLLGSDPPPCTQTQDTYAAPKLFSFTWSGTGQLQCSCHRYLRARTTLCTSCAVA